MTSGNSSSPHLWLPKCTTLLITVNLIWGKICCEMQRKIKHIFFNLRHDLFGTQAHVVCGGRPSQSWGEGRRGCHICTSDLGDTSMTLYRPWTCVRTRGHAPRTTRGRGVFMLSQFAPSPPCQTRQLNTFPRRSDTSHTEAPPTFTWVGAKRQGILPQASLTGYLTTNNFTNSMEGHLIKMESWQRPLSGLLLRKCVQCHAWLTLVSLLLEWLILPSLPLQWLIQLTIVMIDSQLLLPWTTIILFIN